MFVRAFAIGGLINVRDLVDRANVDVVPLGPNTYDGCSNHRLATFCRRFGDTTSLDVGRVAFIMPSGVAA
jgi:hypothetical protein